MSRSESHNFHIKKYLSENGPKQLGEIHDYLKKMNLGYKDRSGLLKKLATLEEYNEIEKFDQAPYPVYSVVKDAALDFANAGEQFSDREMPMPLGFGSMDENYWKRDVTLFQDDIYEKKFIKIMVTRYGFYIFASLLKNLDYWIKKTGGDKKQINSRKIWLNHALDLPKMQDMIFLWFLDHLTEGRVNEDSIKENKNNI